MKRLLLSSLLIANGVVFASPFVIKDIRVDGVSPETGADIISTLPVKVGQTATDNDVANVVRQLFGQDRYADIRASRDGNTLVIKLTERAVFNDVKIEGNKSIPSEALEQNLKTNLISKGEKYDPARLDSFRDGLIDYYHSIGRYNAKIDKEITNVDPSHINATLKIEEGDVAYVKAINFEGNQVFSSKQLTKMLDIQPDVSWWNIFESSKFEQASYSKDLETIRNYYMDRGYAKFALEDAKTDFSNDNKDVTLTYKIHEGEQYNISEMHIVGNTGKMDKQLQEQLKTFKPGQLFRISDLSSIEENIKQVLGDNGFATAKVDIYPIYDDVAKTVKINYVVDAGPRVYVRKIHFEGNDVTSDSTLRREMRQQEGAWLSTGKAALGKERLERTGFYDSVEMTLPNVPNSPDLVDLVYKIRERNTGSVNFGIGYGTESGFSYTAGITQDNFLGMGSTISLTGSRNDYGTSVNLGYTEPYFTKDGVSLGGNIFYEDYDNSKSDTTSKYKRRTYGINGTLSFPVDEYNSYYMGLGLTHDKLRDVEREYTREKYVNSMHFPITSGNTTYSKIKANDLDFSFGWNYNSLNRGYFPTKGTSASIGGKITLPGSDNKYYKLSADFRNYYPLNREQKWVISTRASLAYANGYGGKQVPFYQLYYAGGIGGGLRGFSYGAIGPKAIYYSTDTSAFTNASNDVIGGNAMASAGLELITPTPFISEKYQNNVRTSIFLDAASVWSTKWKHADSYLKTALPNYGDYKRVRASVGVGFQWQSPIGPLAFSYAKPIRKYAGDEIEQFQFSIGSSF